MQTHLILIHGAWQGSWVWQTILPYLDKLGFVSYPIDLPGNGSHANTIEEIGLANINMQTYTNCVAQTIKHIRQTNSFNAKTDKIVIVAHSGAGVIGSQIGELYSKKIDAVIYLAGMMLPPNLSFKMLLEQLKHKGQDASGIEKYLNWNADYSISQVPADAGAKVFLNDLPFVQALTAAEKLTPQATTGLAITAQWTAERLGTVPRLYLECTLDQSVKFEVQQIMQNLVPGAVRKTLDCGHAPHVSQPKATAAIISEYVQSLD